MKILFYCLILFPFVSYSQYGVLDNTFGNNGIVKTMELPVAIDYLYPKSIATDITGKIYVMSKFSVSNEDLGISYDNIMLTSYSKNGNFDYEFGQGGFKTISIGNEVTTGIGLIATNDNSLLMIGSHYPIGQNSNHKIFILKTDLSGNPIVDFGNQGMATINCEGCEGKQIIENEDGSLYVAGSTSVYSQDFDNINLYIAKLNADGTQNFDFGTDGYHYVSEPMRNLKLKEMQIDEQGNFYLLTDASTGSPNFLFKVDPNGDLVASNFLSENFQYFNSIKVDEDKVYVTGSHNSEDFYLLRLNAEDLTKDNSYVQGGEFIYDFGNTGDLSFDLIITNNRVLQVGTSSSQFALLSTFLDGEIDTDFGNNGRTVTYLGDSSNLPIDATVDNASRLFVLDAYYLKIACYKIYDGLSVEDILTDSKIQIAPNPTSNSFVINGLNGNQTQVQIIDLTGKIIQEFQSVQNNQTLNLGAIPKGNYLIKIQSKDKKETKKIIVQ